LPPNRAPIQCFIPVEQPKKLKGVSATSSQAKKPNPD